MSNFVLVGSDCEAFGHPSECVEPVSGTIESEAPQSVSVNGNPIATVDTATISFDSHSHDYSDADGCHNNSSHNIDPETVSTSITINGSAVYIVEDGVATDPITGGNINITTSGNNNSVTES